MTQIDAFSFTFGMPNASRPSAARTPLNPAMVDRGEQIEAAARARQERGRATSFRITALAQVLAAAVVEPEDDALVEAAPGLRRRLITASSIVPSMIDVAMCLSPRSAAPSRLACQNIRLTQKL